MNECPFFAGHCATPKELKDEDSKYKMNLHIGLDINILELVQVLPDFTYFLKEEKKL